MDGFIGERERGGEIGVDELAGGGCAVGEFEELGRREGGLGGEGGERAEEVGALGCLAGAVKAFDGD